MNRAPLGSGGATRQRPSRPRGKRRPAGGLEKERRAAFGAQWGAFMRHAAQQLHREPVK